MRSPAPAGKLIVGTATSGMAKGVVKNFGDRLCIEESVVNLKDVDPSYWAYWLSTTGYESSAGETHPPTEAHCTCTPCTPCTPCTRFHL
jgi:hypothetical protein